MACTTALRDLDTLAYDYELRGVTGVPLQVCEGRLATSHPQCGENLNYGMYHSFRRVYVSLPLSRGLLWPLFFCSPYAFNFLLLRLRQHTAHSATIPFVTGAVSHTG
jgi:hypothetical protein